MKALPAKGPDEVVTITFDFSGLIETIVSATIIASTLRGPDDATPQTILLGALTIVDPEVRQQIAAGQNGTTYKIACTAYDADGEIYELVAALPVRSVRAGEC